MNVRSCVLLFLVLFLTCSVPALAEEAVPEKATKPLDLWGTVVDAAGQPIGGATVSLFKDVTAGPRHYEQVRDAIETDESGRFVFAEVPEGWYAVMAEREGMAKSLYYSATKTERKLGVHLVMKPPVRGVLMVWNEEGDPVEGATLRHLGIRTETGEFWLRRSSSWRAFGFDYPESDSRGRLPLPPLPEGATIQAVVHHPDFVPAKFETVPLPSEEAIVVTLSRGIELVFRAAEPTEVNLDMKTFGLWGGRGHESSFNRHPLPLSDRGEARVTVEAGAYRRLILRGSNVIITPAYFAPFGRGLLEFRDEEQAAPFVFHVRPKRMARGRVINVETGQPLSGVMIRAETINKRRSWKIPDDREALISPWTETGWAETDENGEYEIVVAPGSARVSFHGTGYVAEHAYWKFDVPTDGRIDAPLIHVRPMPKITGRVVNKSGEPVAGAIVRLRGELRNMPPVQTGEQGEFELTPKRIPVDSETDDRLPVQPLVAFHPYKRLMATSLVDLSKLESLGEMTLILRPHAPGELMSKRREQVREHDRERLSPARRAEMTAGSLIGQPAPSLEGTWLNAAPGTNSLKDFRGKYVLLDFWYVGCGPCRRQEPSLKLLHNLYHDRDVVVIGVHNNTHPAEVVKGYIDEEHFPYPVIVDHADGRTIARYEEHGLKGYPTNFLIGPDGRVIDDDFTTPGPMLRRYKIEILRELVLGNGGVGAN